jgi:hypothetical protein
VWSDGEPQPREIFSSHIVNPTAELRQKRQAINEFFKTEMKDDLKDGEKQRHGYYKILKKVKAGKIKFPSNEMSFTMQINPLDGKAPIEQRWITALRFAGADSQCVRIASDSVAVNETLLATAELKLVPFAQVAAVVAINGKECDPVKGAAYVTMPIGDIQTQLPVHMNSGFELATSRRDLCWGRDLTGNDAIRHKWNELMVGDVLSEAYAALMSEMMRQSDITYNYYGLWPLWKDNLSAQWVGIWKPLFERMARKKDIMHSTGIVVETHSKTPVRQFWGIADGRFPDYRMGQPTIMSDMERIMSTVVPFLRAHSQVIFDDGLSWSASDTSHVGVREVVFNGDCLSVCPQLLLLLLSVCPQLLLLLSVCPQLTLPPLSLSFAGTRSLQWIPAAQRRIH